MEPVDLHPIDGGDGTYPRQAEQKVHVAAVARRLGGDGAMRASARELVAWTLVSTRASGPVFARELRALADKTDSYEELTALTNCAAARTAEFFHQLFSHAYGSGCAKDLPRKALMDTRSFLLHVLRETTKATDTDANQWQVVQLTGAMVQALSEYDPESAPEQPVDSLWRILSAYAGGSSSTKRLTRRLNWYGAVVRYALLTTSRGLRWDAAREAMLRHAELHKEIQIQMEMGASDGTLPADAVTLARAELNLPMPDQTSHRAPKRVSFTDAEMDQVLAPFMDALDEEGPAPTEPTEPPSEDEPPPEDELAANQTTMKSYFRIIKVAHLTPRLDISKQALATKRGPQEAATTVARRAKNPKAPKSTRASKAVLAALLCDEVPFACPLVAPVVPETTTWVSTDPFWSFTIGQVLQKGPQVAWLQQSILKP